MHDIIDWLTLHVVKTGPAMAETMNDKNRFLEPQPQLGLRKQLEKVTPVVTKQKITRSAATSADLQ